LALAEKSTCKAEGVLRRKPRLRYLLPCVGPIGFAAASQWRIQPASQTEVSNLDFAFSQEAFKQAAQRLGIKPHRLQAILWYGEKHHWASQGWSKGDVSAAMESYIPQLKAYAAPELAPQKQTLGGWESLS
jgi:hypothetical protein